jgi:hypothetical protein
MPVASASGILPPAAAGRSVNGQEAIARKAASGLLNIVGAGTTTEKVRRQDLTNLTSENVASF